MVQAGATGISVDAGLTPAEDRWIVRFQYRQMGMTSGMHQMDSDVLMGVLAYGISRDVTLMVKQMNLHRTMHMAGMQESSTGWSDFTILSKFGLYRKNTRTMILAVAPTVAVKLPSGSAEFTSDTWDLQLGLYGSWRSGRLGSDLNVSYAWTGFTGASSSGTNPGNETGLDAAFSYQFSMGNSGNLSIAPVLEFTYRHTSSDQVNGSDSGNGGSVFFISPGVKTTWNSFILEFLVQFPVDQNYAGTDLDHRSLAGIRYMF